MVALPARSAIRFYQVFVSGQQLPVCNFQPSCSAFSMAAYGCTDPLQATLMTFDRLMRCNYWNFGEYPFIGGKLIDPAQEHLLWGRIHRQRRGTRLTATADRPRPERSAAEEATGDLQAELDFADAMAQKGEVEIALAEYEYLANQASSSPLRSAALFHQGWVFFQEKRFSEAADVFEKLRTAVPAGSSAEADAQLLAHLTLSMVEEQPESHAQQVPLLRYITVWGSIRAGSVAVARKSLDELTRSPDADVARASQKSLALVDSLGLPRVRKAWVAGGLSALVPGLGRLYTGRYGDAAFSSMVTAGSAALAVRSVRAEHWVNAALFGSGATGFYLGNVYGSIASAAVENHRAQQRLGAALVAAGETERLLPQQLVAARLLHCLPAADAAKRSPPSEAMSSRWRVEGEDHFQRAEWGAAARCYRLCVYWTARGTSMDSVLLRLGQSLEREGDDRGAQRCFGELLDRYPASLLAEETRLALARLHLRHGEGELARLELEDEVAHGTAPEQVTEAGYLMTWVYLGQHEWKKAERWLQEPHRFDQSQDYAKALRGIAQNLNNYHARPHRSPRLARLFSAVVPGAGQIYAGKPLDGMVSFAVNSAITYSLMRSVRSENWLDSTLIFGLLFHRFYVGNIYNAGRYAVAFDEAQDVRLVDKIRGEVRGIESSLDPLRSE